MYLSVAGSRRDSIVSMLLILPAIFILFGIASSEVMSACPSNGLPVINMCESGSIVRPSLLIDFSLAQHSSVSTCHCEVLIIQGKQFHFSQVIAPGYVGCGTEIHVQKTDKPHSGDIIPCYGGTTVSGLREGNTLKITVMKHNSPFDAHYCYRLDITGVPRAAMSVTCYDEITETTQTHPSTLDKAETTPLMTTSPIQTDGITRQLRNSSLVGEKNLSLVPYTSNGRCIESTLFTVIALLLVLLTTVACYAAIITFKYLTRNDKSQKLQQSSDIYEEIPAYLSSHPVYETELQRCSGCQNGGRTAPPLEQGHWNWTYDEHRAQPSKPGKTFDPDIYDYEVAKF